MFFSSSLNLSISFDFLVAILFQLNWFKVLMRKYQILLVINLFNRHCILDSKCPVPYTAVTTLAVTVLFIMDALTIKLLSFLFKGLCVYVSYVAL